MSVVNLSAMTVTSAPGSLCWICIAVDRPTTPAPRTAIRTIPPDRSVFVHVRTGNFLCYMGLRAKKHFISIIGTKLAFPINTMENQ